MYILSMLEILRVETILSTLCHNTVQYRNLRDLSRIVFWS